MQYPLISEYVKAIQDAGDNLDKLSYLTPVQDDHGEPYRSSGAFAVVFKMQDKSSGKYYALKCFTEEQEGRADAYRQIADELDLLDSPYITSVKYMEKEFFVDSQCEEDEFPVLLMDWVDGETMEAYIAANYRNQSAMSMLSYRFGKMAAWLRTQSFSHGDIKPDNIIVRPDGSLTLVDYDGMFVPSMKGSQSPTIGTRDFSHPLRTVDDFDETIDDFSLASIALSLKAISMKSTLLDIYGASDRLLFSENDYRTPSNSKVISALQGLMCDKDFCTLYSLFMLALARKELSTCSFRLFIGEKPILPQTIEDLPTKATEEERKEAFVDEWGVKYSKDGRKLLKAPYELDRTYSIRKGTKVVCDMAFSLCSSLTEIVIPNSVASIGDSAFLGCESLTEVVIPNSVVCINGNPFHGWNGKLECLSPSFVYEDNILFNKDKSRIISFINLKLTSYVIPVGVTSIGDEAFWGCSSLSDIVIPDGVTSIGDEAFGGCTSLSSLVIPDSVTSIGESAFDNCESLTNISIPKSVTSIGDRAFSGCSSLAEILIPNSVTNIGKFAFCGCSSLADVVIPDGVTSIGNNAFMSCSSLEYISLPKSVICLNGNPFFNWNGKLECLSPNFIYEDKVLFDKDKNAIIAFRDKDTTSYVIPDSVTNIGDSAFRGCSSLSDIVIPDGVTSIGDEAFGGCTSLSSLVIPDSVTSIGESAFDSCESLTDIVIPNSVTSIGDSAFSGCSSLANIVIPDSVTSIGSGAFAFSSLSSIVIPDSVTSIGICAFRGCKSLKSLEIPSSVTSIGESAFNNCSSLRSVVISNGVTSIGNGVFSGCNSLSNIVIPDSVTNIGDSAFRGCSSLSDIVIPDGVTSIGDEAFWGCTSLRSVVIPNSVTSIGSGAFAFSSLSSIVIPDSVTSIGDEAFCGCSSLKYISIPKSVICLNGNPFFRWDGKLECLSPNFIYEDNILFNKDKSRIISFRNLKLTSYVIPDGVTSIGDYTFRSCWSLSSVVIPDSVTRIGNEAFCGCTSLSNIILPDSVTSIGESAFEGCSFPYDLKQELISRFGEKIFGVIY